MEAIRSDSAARVQLHRERRKSGYVVGNVEVSADRWAKLLTRSKLLDPNKADDPKAMFEALSQWLAVALVAIEEDFFR